MQTIFLTPFEKNFLYNFVFPAVPQTEHSEINKMGAIRNALQKTEDEYLVKYTEIVDGYYVKVKNADGKEVEKIPADKIDECEKACSEIVLEFTLDDDLVKFVYQMMIDFPKNYKSKDGSFGIKGKSDVLNFISIRDKFNLKLDIPAFKDGQEFIS